MSNRIEPAPLKDTNDTHGNQDDDVFARFKDISLFIYEQNVESYKEYFSNKKSQSYTSNLAGISKTNKNQTVESKICVIL